MTELKLIGQWLPWWSAIYFSAPEGTQEQFDTLRDPHMSNSCNKTTNDTLLLMQGKLLRRLQYLKYTRSLFLFLVLTGRMLSKRKREHLVERNDQLLTERKKGGKFHFSLRWKLW